MAWLNMPPALGTDMSAHSTLIELWRSATEKAWAIGHQFWPDTNRIWTSGPADNLTDNGDGTFTLTDDHATFVVPNNRWFGYVDPDPTNSWIPQNYDLIVDDADESKVVRSPILASTYAAGIATYKLDGSALQAFITSKQIPSIASLIGKSYYVIKSGSISGGSYWWSDRFPEWPNDFEYWNGTSTASTATSMTDSAATWFTHEWQPIGPLNRYELMIFAGGVLQRIPILDSMADPVSGAPMLTFAAQAAAPSGPYSIIKAGGRWRSSPKWHPPTWYRGAFKKFLSHHPNDEIHGVNQVLAGVTLASGPGCLSSFFLNLIDEDAKTEVEDVCNTADEYFNPDMWKTPRGLQIWMEAICHYFVKKGVTYDHGTAIQPFTWALFFQSFNCNIYATTVTALSGDGITIPAPGFAYFPYYPIPVYYTTLDAAGNAVSDGIGTATSSTHISGSFVALDAGRSLVISLGWTRNPPRKVRYMFYKKQQFIPGISSGALGDPPAGTVVDPPTPTTPGLWKLRAKSTTYKDHSPTGLVIEGNTAFVDRDLARYDGDNFGDPTIHDPLIAETDDARLVTYYDNFYTGAHDPSHAALDAMPSGTSTGGSTTQLQDTSARWWASVMRTETGTADSGSTTSLGDSTKATNGLWDPATLRWVGFIVEVTIGGATHRRPITGFSGTTISWSEALPASANGAAYRIREPGAGGEFVVGYELNRYGERDLIVSDPAPGGLTYTIPILYSDDNTLYFAPQPFAIGAKWAYSISEHKPNGVWQRDAATSSWIVPVGMDPRGAPFHANQNENLPTKYTDYGRYRKGDYFSLEMITELVNGFNQLVWTWVFLNFVAELIDGTPENNFKQADDLSYASYASAQTFFASAWGAAPTSGTDPSMNSYSATVGSAAGPPYAYASCTRAGSPSPPAAPPGVPDTWDLGGARVYCYAVAACPPYMQSSIEYYVYGTIDPADHAPSAAYAFAADGDPIEYHHWRKFDSAGASNAASRKSIAFGNPALPVPSAPAEPAADGLSTYAGYYVGNQIGIIKWDVPGGMNYL